MVTEKIFESALGISSPWFIALAILVVVGGGASATAGTVNFVSCPADGMLGPLPPPVHSQPVVIPGPELKGSLAYYKAPEGIGVFAPVGWQCREWYGSGGIVLIVAPHTVSPLYRGNSSGPAVTVSSIDGGTSGSLVVAQLIMQLFPKQDRTFVAKVTADEKWNYTPRRNYRRYSVKNDIFHRVTPTLLEFTAPANSTGIGTGKSLSASDQPIAGLVMLVPPRTGPGIYIVRVRLGTTQHELTSVILKLMIERHRP